MKTIDRRCVVFVKANGKYVRRVFPRVSSKWPAIRQQDNKNTISRRGKKKKRNNPATIFARKD